MKLNIKELLTLPEYILFALVLSTGTILFSPDSFLKKIYMITFRNDYGFIIGIVFLVSTAILVTKILKATCTIIVEKLYLRKQRKKLHTLSDYQKFIIYGLYVEHNRTATLPLHDGAVRELETWSMIGKATTQYMVSDLNNAMFPYLLHPWVCKELDSNNELLDDFKKVTTETINTSGF